jgi:hypothetical protein
MHKKGDIPGPVWDDEYYQSYVPLKDRVMSSDTSLKSYQERITESIPNIRKSKLPSDGSEEYRNHSPDTQHDGYLKKNKKITNIKIRKPQLLPDDSGLNTDLDRYS